MLRARFDALSEQRRHTMVRVGMLGASLNAIHQTAIVAAIGVMLLLAGQAMAAGSFTVGDFALFTYYLWFTADLPGYLGAFVGDIKQQEVAIDRLVELIPDEPPQALLAAEAQASPSALAATSPALAANQPTPTSQSSSPQALRSKLRTCGAPRPRTLHSPNSPCEA